MLAVRRNPTLYGYLVALCLGLAVPLIAISGSTTYLYATSERDQLQRVAHEASREVLLGIEREVGAHVAALKSLSHATSLDTSDLSDFYMHALTLAAAKGQGTHVVLRDAVTGRQLINTRVPWGTMLATWPLQDVERALKRGERAFAVTGLQSSPVTGELLALVTVPVMAGDEVVSLLSSTLPLERLSSLVTSRALPDAYWLSIVDQTGMIVARSREVDQFVGKRRLPGFDDLRTDHGTWNGVNPAGVPVFGVFRRSTEVGYLIAVGVAQSALSAPLRHSLLIIGLAAALLAAFGASAAVVISRGLARRVALLVHEAQSLGERRGLHVSPEFGSATFVLPLQEADLISAALGRTRGTLHDREKDLVEAQADLERRVAERTQELEANRAFLRTVLDHMDQGLIVIAPDRRLPVISRRATELLNLPPQLVDAVPSYDEFVAHLTDSGEFADADSAMRAFLDAGAFYTDRTHIFERARPDGTVLEIRTVPLEDGGGVRTYTDVTGRKQHEQTLVESEARYRTLADALPQIVWIMRSSDGEATFVNRAFRAYFGDIGTSRGERIARNHPDDAPKFVDAWNKATLLGEAFAIEGRLRRSDGAFRWHKLVMIPIRKGDDTIEWLGTALDIDDIVTARRDLEESSSLLRLAQDAAGAGVWEWDIEREMVRLSPESARLHGLGDPGHTVEMSGTEWAALVHPDDLEAVRATRKRMLSDLTDFSVEFRVNVSGSSRWVHAVGRRAAKLGNFGTYLVGLAVDITPRKLAEQQAEQMARYDGLTGLPNRTMLFERLNATVARSDGSRTADQAALLLLDLDRFKAVNDTLGHPAGDALLRGVARRIEEMAGRQALVARLGGDEFAIVLAFPASGEDCIAEQARSVAERVVLALNEPIWLAEACRAVQVGSSVGIALAPYNAQTATDLFRKADLALYRAKAEGRSTARLYSPEMDLVVEERRRLELDLKGALTRGEFEVHYQPVVATASGETCGFEALVRWRHAQRGLVSPNAFIPLCEEVGLMTTVGDWVLREACAQAARWADHSLRVAVNVSAVQFRGGELLRSVTSALAASGLKPERLELEITESVLMQDVDEVTGTLAQLRSLGVRVALDDFGTGYSSLSYLRSFPFDKIKIDRSFVQNIEDPHTAAIVRAIVALASRLQTTITAEGVETKEQFELVRAEGCSEAQGYLFSPPKPAYEFALTNEQGQLARGEAA
jgi:diguanylate cyclase (GGDEF)-like protein/PAS domain S-box-containing protein